MVFGLGVTEIALILVVAIAVIGPKNFAKIKPFLKGIYKAYLRIQQEADATKAQVVDIEAEVKREISEVKKQAESEFLDDVKKARDEFKEELKADAEKIKEQAEKFEKEVKKETAQAKKVCKPCKDIAEKKAR